MDAVENGYIENFHSNPNHPSYYSRYYSDNSYDSGFPSYDHEIDYNQQCSQQYRSPPPPVQPRQPYQDYARPPPTGRGGNNNSRGANNFVRGVNRGRGGNNFRGGNSNRNPPFNPPPVNTASNDNNANRQFVKVANKIYYLDDPRFSNLIPPVGSGPNWKRNKVGDLIRKQNRESKNLNPDSPANRDQTPSTSQQNFQNNVRGGVANTGTRRGRPFFGAYKNYTRAVAGAPRDPVARSRELGITIVSNANISSVKGLDKVVNYYKDGNPVSKSIRQLYDEGCVIRYNVNTSSVTSINKGDHMYRISGSRLIRIDSVRLDSQTLRLPFRTPSAPSRLVQSIKLFDSAPAPGTYKSPQSALTFIYQSHHDYGKPGLLSLTADSAKLPGLYSSFADVLTTLSESSSKNPVAMCNYFESKTTTSEDPFNGATVVAPAKNSNP